MTFITFHISDHNDKFSSTRIALASCLYNDSRVALLVLFPQPDPESGNPCCPSGGSPVPQQPGTSCG